MPTSENPISEGGNTALGFRGYPAKKILLILQQSAAEIPDNPTSGIVFNHMDFNLCAPWLSIKLVFPCHLKSEALKGSRDVCSTNRLLLYTPLILGVTKCLVELLLFGLDLRD